MNCFWINGGNKKFWLDFDMYTLSWEVLLSATGRWAESDHASFDRVKIELRSNFAASALPWLQLRAIGATEANQKKWKNARYPKFCRKQNDTRWCIMFKNCFVYNLHTAQMHPLSCNFVTIETLQLFSTAMTKRFIPLLNKYCINRGISGGNHLP